MTNEALVEWMNAKLPGATWEEGTEWPTLVIPADDLHALMKELRSDKETDMDYLFCLTCIDWSDHLLMVYHLLSKQHKHTLVVKAKITNIEQPQIRTVTDIWKTAIFHEREVYDLFGVRFEGHPDMRRLFLDEDWEGYPLRKNYVDENMITL